MLPMNPFLGLVPETQEDLETERSERATTEEFPDLGVDHFRSILMEAAEQVVSGKGEERHGAGADLYDQPWLHIAQAVGTGFLSGQAIKKVMEAASMSQRGRFTGAQFEREMLGAIAYLTFAIMHKRLQDAHAD